MAFNQLPIAKHQNTIHNSQTEMSTWVDELMYNCIQAEYSEHKRKWVHFKMNSMNNADCS